MSAGRALLDTSTTGHFRNFTAAGQSSDGLYMVSGNVTVRNSILAGNFPDIGGGATLAVSHSLVGDGTGGGTVNILTGDPGFDEEWFHLTPDSPCRNGADSPCIDAGTNLVWMTEATDLRGFPRRSHGLPTSGGAERVDMGAFEVRIPPSGSLFMVR